jgi:hypothetical protein
MPGFAVFGGIGPEAGLSQIDRLGTRLNIEPIHSPNLSTGVGSARMYRLPPHCSQAVATLMCTLAFSSSALAQGRAAQFQGVERLHWCTTP